MLSHMFHFITCNASYLQNDILAVFHAALLWYAHFDNATQTESMQGSLCNSCYLIWSVSSSAMRSNPLSSQTMKRPKNASMSRCVLSCSCSTRLRALLR